MNERWMRGALQALACLLVPVLGACAVGRLSDRIVIDAATQVTDEGGNDLLLTTDLTQENDFKLQPGDMLTYTRWSPGLALAKDAVSFHTHEPTSDQHAIALRLISPSGRLCPDEARFLGTILTTQRQKWSDAGLGSDSTRRIGILRGILDRNQISLWNALVTNIHLKRLQRPVPNPGKNSNVLVATIRMKELCKALESEASEAQLFAETFIDPSGQGCGATPGKPKELTNPPSIPLSPLYAASSPSPGKNDPNHYFETANSGYVQFNFTQVERNGVRVDRRESPEARWTLREWEDSGICKIRGGGGTPVIRRIRLIGGRRKIWIHREPGDFPPTYRLQVRLTKDTSRRWIERISDEDTFEEHAVLDASALDVLQMSDLDFVEWGSPLARKGPRRLVVDVRPNGCKFFDAN